MSGTEGIWALHQMRRLRRVSDDRHLPWLLILFAVEAAIFYRSMIINFAPYFPMNFDQTSYMFETYDLIARTQHNGWKVLIQDYLNPAHVMFAGFVVQSAVLGLLAGPGRTAIVSLNLVYFVLLQIILFSAVRQRTGNATLAWLAIAFLLLCQTIFISPGGIYDYRVDFSATCLYGIWICSIYWSRQFRSIPGSVTVGVIGIFLITTRLLTIIYVAAVLGGLLVVFLIAFRLNRSRAEQKNYALGARNVLISSIIVAAVSAPIVFVARHVIYDYYIVGHIVSDEKYIRERELGLHSALDHLLYYPRSILFEHIGSMALIVMFIAAAATLLSFILIKGADPPRSVLLRMKRQWFDFVAVGLAIVVPILVLTSDIAKSPVVGGIVVVPTILIVVLFCASLWPSPGTTPVSAVGFIWRSLAASAVVLASILVLLTRGIANPWSMPRTDREQITKINETIARHVVDNSIEHPRVSFDQVVDYLNLPTLRLSAYESTGHVIFFEPRFGNYNYGIFATPRDVAMNLLADSDIIVLTDPIRGREAPYPINTKIREYWDDLWAWTTQNRARLVTTEILGVPYHVFAMPTAKIEGASAGWITSAGLSIEVDADHLRRWPVVILDGTAIYDVLGGVPGVQAAFVDGTGHLGGAIPASLGRTDQAYKIVIDTRGARPPTLGRVTIRLTFDRFFVPSKLGINADIRELVMFAPTKHELRDAPP